MLACEAAEVLADGEALGLVFPERDARRLADRASLWARVLSDVRAEEASAALVVLARRGLANPVKPGELLAIVKESRRIKEQTVKDHDRQLVAEEESRRLADPEYRARYEAARIAALGAVRHDHS